MVGRSKWRKKSLLEWVRAAPPTDVTQRHNAQMARVNRAFWQMPVAWLMRQFRHRRHRPRRLNHAARTLLLLGWMAVTVGLTTVGLSVEWAATIFFLGPIAVDVAPMLVRWMSNIPRQKRSGIDWSVVAMASSVAVVGFFAALWWPWSLPTAAPKAPPLPLAVSASKAPFSCRVTSVHDGDTLRCADGTRVRLHAVAAREIDETCSAGHPCPTASAATARFELVKLAENRTLECHRTGQSYNRVTAICDNDEGVEINCAMVRSGTALIWDRFHRQQPICRAG